MNMEVPKLVRAVLRSEVNQMVYSPGGDSLWVATGGNPGWIRMSGEPLQLGKLHIFPSNSLTSPQTSVVAHNWVPQ